MNMRMLLGAAGALTLMAAPAMAQSVSGDVTITGSVASKCTVIGGASASTFADTISLGELAGQDGALRTDLTGSASAGSAAFRVNCTQAGATIDVDAETMVNGDVATAPANYSRAIDYSADLVAEIAGGSTETVTDASSNPAATSRTLTGQYLANAADNIQVQVHSFQTVGAATDLLTAGDYEGHVLVTITPGS